MTTNKEVYSSEETKKFLRDRVSRPGGSGVISFDSEGRVLLVKAFYKNYWSFPGGWIELDQTPLDAAIQEYKEEVGLELRRDTLSLAFVLNRQSEIMQSYQFIFKSSMTVTKDMLSNVRVQEEEITDWKLVTREEILADIEEYSVTVGIWAKDEKKAYYEMEVPA